MHPHIIIEKGREQRQFQGHPWVYAGEITRTIGRPRDGGVVDCYSHDDVFLGRGYFNSRSKIRLRILTRHIAEEVNEALFRRRLRAALTRRQRLYPDSTSLRLVHAEGDGLPGLTVDRYGNVLVLQCTSMGMDRQLDLLSKLLVELTGITQLYVRNDLNARQQEGLESGNRFYGEPFATTVPIQEHGVTFEVDLSSGHKTGFYLDQADNHLLVRSFLVPGGAMLDAFCYTGAFALHAAAAGAGRVVGIESSAPTLALAQRNADLNAFGAACHFEASNVFSQLRLLQRQGERFDVVVLDPPSFTHQRQNIAKALDGYKEINLRALRLLRPGGMLVSFSCSHYIERSHFEAMLLQAAYDARRQLIVRHRLGQAAHHPAVMSIPETSYLKGLAVEVW